MTLRAVRGFFTHELDWLTLEAVLNKLGPSTIFLSSNLIPATPQMDDLRHISPRELGFMWCNNS